MGLWGMPWRQKPKKGVASLRYASTSCLASLIGDSRMWKHIFSDTNPYGFEVSGGTETSKYPEEKKSNEIPLVAVSEMGRA